MNTSWQRKNRSALFARPSLGLFVAGAVVILAVSELFSLFTPEAFSQNVRRPPRQFTSYELMRLLEEAEDRPSSATFRLLAQYYEQRRDYRRAMSFLRKAELLRQTEEARE